MTKSDKTLNILLLAGIGGVAYYGIKKYTPAFVNIENLDIVNTTQNELIKAQQLWRETGENIWIKVKSALENSRAKIDRATFSISYSCLENNTYKEYFLRTSTVTQILMLQFWQVCFGIDFSPIIEELKPDIDKIITQTMGQQVAKTIWNVASAEMLAVTLSSLGFSSVTKVTLSQMARSGIRAVLVTIPAIGTLLAVASLFLPTPSFIADLFKPRIKGSFVMPFPENSLKILKYLTVQNAEYLFMLPEFRDKESGLFVLNRMIELQEYREPLATPFYPNKFMEIVRIEGRTSIENDLIDLSRTIREISADHPLFNVPYNTAYDETVLCIDDRLADEIVVVGSEKYKKLWEQATGRKFDEKIEIPLNVVLSQERDPYTLLPTYTPLLYNLPYRPFVIFPNYPAKIMVKCPNCGGRGYTIDTSSGILGIHPKVKVATCKVCGGFGFIMVGI